MKELTSSTIEFLEPLPRKLDGHYHISAIITKNGKSSVKELKISTQKQKSVIDYLISIDRKLTCAVIHCDRFGNFTIKKHSPQMDFLELVKEEKCI